MAAFAYDLLTEDYDNFTNPLAIITINGKNFSENKKGLAISDVEVEMTSGFAASIASFWIYGGYSREQSRFLFDDMKNYILLGSCVVIHLGYENQVREVFRGFIAKVNFSFQADGIPGVQITAMDVKGVMMSGSYSRQLLAKYFSDAVKEILRQTEYTTMQSNGIITKIEITDTPDKPPAGSDRQQNANDRTIEMVGESDYEFVVKAAKKYNYEFFTVGGTVYFRKAKDNPEILLEIGPGKGLLGYEVVYDITGQVESVEVRSTDAGKARQISKSQKINSKYSQGSKAKAILAKSKKVHTDNTISSKEDAEYRLSYLVEDISYQLGMLKAEFIGLPELTPGRFLKVDGLGTAVDNTFYLTTIRHIMNAENGYITRVTGRAATML